jgi:hypothetical protein
MWHDEWRMGDERKRPRRRWTTGVSATRSREVGGQQVPGMENKRRRDRLTGGGKGEVGGQEVLATEKQQTRGGGATRVGGVRHQLRRGGSVKAQEAEVRARRRRRCEGWRWRRRFLISTLTWYITSIFTLRRKINLKQCSCLLEN